MMSKPTPQHQWLRQLIGDWTFEVECSAGPDKPPQKSSGTERVSMLGDLWLILDGRGMIPATMDGGISESRMTIGYDPAKKRFVGSWIATITANMFIYEGELDATQKILPLTTTGPSFQDPAKLATYQDVIELQGPDRRLLWSRIQGDDGHWHRFMTATYTRA